ncbi:MAG: hypothetical protein STSR0008_00730 [Ignavibacterium sp.]
MSLLNSLFSGVSGIRANQTMMDVIGNNISNVNSIGFKGSRVTFSDAFHQFVRFGTNPTETSGGTNAFQVGLGTKISSIDRNWNQGTFERTGLLTDLALQGQGLFVLNSNGQKFYSRAGTFNFDANGKLVHSQNGAIVQGKVATADGIIPPGNNLEDIVVDPNLKLPAVATTFAKWGGNLSSISTITPSEKYVQSGNINSTLAVGDSVEDSNLIYDENGNEYRLYLTYTKTAADTYDMNYELKDSNDTTVIGPTTQSVTFDPVTGEMLTPPTINITDATLGINFNLDVSTVTQLSTSTTLSSAVDDNREPTIVNGTLTIFDSLGNPHTLTLKYTKTATNSWNWTASVPASSGTLTGNKGTITFNSDGSINTISPNPPVLSFVPGSGASLQNIELDFGKSFDGITQTSANSVISALNQNGSASATLADLSIDQYGNIVGVFSNGFSRNLAQIMLASFPNLSGLTSVGDNMYTVSANSGDPFIGTAGEETGTTIQSGALEQSNVDLSEEFTRMIVSQRGFQANARVITVSDSLLQEVTNLIR